MNILPEVFVDAYAGMVMANIKRYKKITRKISKLFR